MQILRFSPRRSKTELKFLLAAMIYIGSNTNDSISLHHVCLKLTK